MNDYFKYRFGNDISLNINEKEFITIMGNNNDLIINTLLYGNVKCNIFVGDREYNRKNIDIIRRRMSIILHKHINIFVSETVKDELAFPLESLAFKKDDITSIIESKSRLFKLNDLLERDPNSLGISDKVKLKILSSLIINPKILILDNMMCELDYNDKLLIFDVLEEYVAMGGIVINFTNDIEESLNGDKLIIIFDKKLICEGKTLSVLNEEKLLKRLGIGLPFIIEMSKYMMDYGIINKYYLSNSKLVGAIWK